MKNKLRAIIVDDEKDGRKVIQRLVENFCKNVEIIGEASNVEEASRLITETHPDFIFLDIQMPGGDGFELLKKFKPINFEVVFVTSFDKYAIQAIKFSAVDYLLKPVDIEELISTISRVEERIQKKSMSHKDGMVHLLNNLNQDALDMHIALQKSDKVRYVKVSNIAVIEADSNYSRIYLHNNENFLHSKTLKYFEELLTDKKIFFRATKSHLVNLQYVHEYSKSEPCVLTLTNQFSVEISRRKKGELLSLMEELASK
jgi:two-component system, LytTR family, response regulator